MDSSSEHLIADPDTKNRICCRQYSPKDVFSNHTIALLHEANVISIVQANIRNTGEGLHACTY